MVIYTFILSILFGFSLPALELKFEFKKDRFYRGEVVQGSWVLYGENIEYEIEIAKFPEFRGFWKNNLNLKQGKIYLEGTGEGSGLRKAIVATYEMASFIDESKNEIKPIELIVRTPSGFQTYQKNATDQYVTGVVPQYEVLALPPNPTSAPFIGGVGQFTLHAPRRITFRKGRNEKAGLDITIKGNGNFPQMEMKLNFDSRIKQEKLSPLSYGSPFKGQKGFRWRIDFPSHKPHLILNQQSVSYFDPDDKTYKTLKISPIMSSYQAVKSEEIPSLQEDLAQFEERKKATHSIKLNPERVLWILLFLSVFTGFVYLLLSQLKKKQNKKIQKKEASSKKVEEEVAQENQLAFKTTNSLESTEQILTAVKRELKAAFGCGHGWSDSQWETFLSHNHADLLPFFVKLKKDVENKFLPKKQGDSLEHSEAMDLLENMRKSIKEKSES